MTPAPGHRRIWPVLAAMTGTLVERWLFFAEARHTVMLFYGEQQA